MLQVCAFHHYDARHWKERCVLLFPKHKKLQNFASIYIKKGFVGNKNQKNIRAHTPKTNTSVGACLAPSLQLTASVGVNGQQACGLVLRPGHVQDPRCHVSCFCWQRCVGLTLMLDDGDAR